MCCLFCLFICVCPFGSCKSTYLLSFSIFLDHLDLAIYQLIYLLTYWSICLLFYLLVYWPIWEHDSLIWIYIYIYSILFYLYHLVIISLYSYCQTICKSPISVSSIYILQFLPVCTYFSPYFFCLCVSLSCACLSVVFSKDLGPGKYTYDPRI